MMLIQSWRLCFSSYPKQSHMEAEAVIALIPLFITYIAVVTHEE
jgi:hypothetical protein